ncbi:ribosomal protection-like ABC-F family protein [Paenibacillus sp. R14(2021)]|uniref:ribosomal protection-like ABC-F family protein n=1 Tax=Paenibacillus sp. R14(2021) TaxID=2859228 RepID=UPI001C613ACA|nr:ABC-F type ribosomal protection protein [Paenibacillus sp. R14(2021)]
MTTLLTIRNLRKSFGDTEVLKQVSADIGARERIGLVGMNGAGKSTLANLIFGSLLPDAGQLIRHMEGMRIGYLLQSTSYTVHTFSSMLEGESGRPDNGDFLEVTSHLGLRRVKEWDDSRLSGLSGGEKTKLALAHIWTSEPNILLLDEPTNHLDFQGVDWLVDELKSFGGTTILISHDRYFLDETVDRIIELQDGVSTAFPGNYAFYRAEKERRYLSQQHQYEEQQKYEQKIEAEIARLKNWSEKAHREAGKKGKMAEMRAGVKEFYRSKAKSMDKQIKSRIHRLEKIEIEGVEKPKEESKISFGWENAGKRGRRIVEASRISKSFGDRQLIADSSFYLRRGEKVGLIGPNGSGKTTLIGMLLAQQDVDSGQLWMSPTVKAAYLTQDVSDLDEGLTVLELLQEAHEIRSDIGKARTMLAHMGFHAAMLMKPVRQLSLGERTRIKLAQLMMREQDLLILDEPTNHLDLASREQLEQTLQAYNGTLIIVSHDRYLIDSICTKLLVIEEGSIRRLESGYKDYRERARGEAANSAGKTRQMDDASEKRRNLLEQQQREEELLIVMNQMTYLLGELSKLKPTDNQYAELDEAFKQQAARKKQLLQP